MHNYVISGLKVVSDIHLPGAIPNPLGAQEPDVRIRREVVPQSLPGATDNGPTWEMTGTSFLLRVPNLVRMLMTSGNDIAFQLEPGAVDHDASGFILGTGFGILLHQRGALVLHGSAVAREGRAFAICGVSGAGKSTLAAALCNHGFAFAADDLCVIGQDNQHRPIVLPDGRQLKLWKESIEKLDLAERQGEAVRTAFEKYYMEPSGAAVSPPLLSAIYILRDERPSIKKGITVLSLPDAVRALDYEAYRPGIREKIGQRPEMLLQAATTFRHAKVFWLIRPRGFEHMEETIASLLAHWTALNP